MHQVSALWNHSLLSFFVANNSEMHLLTLWPWPLTFQPQNHNTSRISYPKVIPYQVWTLWIIFPDNQTNGMIEYAPTDRRALDNTLIHTTDRVLKLSRAHFLQAQERVAAGAEYFNSYTGNYKCCQAPRWCRTVLSSTSSVHWTTVIFWLKVFFVK